MDAPKRSEGRRLLQAFLTNSGKTQRDIAQGIKRTDPTISAWVSGRYVPDVTGAFLLETFTAGAVPAKAWAEKPRRNRAA